MDIMGVVDVMDVMVADISKIKYINSNKNVMEMEDASNENYKIIYNNNNEEDENELLNSSIDKIKENKNLKYFYTLDSKNNVVENFSDIKSNKNNVEKFEDVQSNKNDISFNTILLTLVMFSLIILFVNWLIEYCSCINKDLLNAKSI